MARASLVKMRVETISFVVARNENQVRLSLNLVSKKGMLGEDPTEYDFALILSKHSEAGPLVKILMGWGFSKTEAFSSISDIQSKIGSLYLW